MSVAAFVARARRALRKPPAHVVRRLLSGARHELDRFVQPRFGREFRAKELLKATGAASVDELWERRLNDVCWPFAPATLKADQYEALCPSDTARIVRAAERAARHEIDLLGSGDVLLGSRIDWHRDFKTGDRWPLGYFRGIDYINRDRPSDVKTVWELSRLQWVLPCGQAYVLTGEERYAVAAREIIDQWIEANPYACSVNWGVTMEPALRIFSWTWLFFACGRSEAWSQSAFRENFLCNLYLHALFTERFFERSDINGNHFTADAAALVLAGAFFGAGNDAHRWLHAGLDDLEREIVLQVHPDGVDFEASAAYHRLVAELFLAAAVIAEARGRNVSDIYRERLAAMARFTAAYMRPDDTAPLWGDNDDARTLPFGPQSLRDHRYLIGLIGLYLGDDSLVQLAGGPHAEAAWWFGPETARALPDRGRQLPSQAFRDGGVYVLRSERDHVFIDCGPVGLGGRGGHGHNDLLSFEAVLDGVPLITEGGCFVYTADFASRNRDRSTSSHNTPMVDGEEINRFIGPEFLWNLIPDARHELVEFSGDGDLLRFFGRHDGFKKCAPGVLVERTIVLNERTHGLRIIDRFFGEGNHTLRVPLHLHPGVLAQFADSDRVMLQSGRSCFAVSWQGAGWTLELERGRAAENYGEFREMGVLVWKHAGALENLEVLICPHPHEGRGAA